MDGNCLSVSHCGVHPDERIWLEIFLPAFFAARDDLIQNEQSEDLESVSSVLNAMKKQRFPLVLLALAYLLGVVIILAFIWCGGQKRHSRVVNLTDGPNLAYAASLQNHEPEHILPFSINNNRPILPAGLNMIAVQFTYLWVFWGTPLFQQYR